MSWFQRNNTKTAGLLCLSFTTEGVALAATPDPQQSAAISHVEFLTAQGEQQFTVLKKYLFEHNLTGMDCAVVLPPSAYRLVQIETPEVDEETLSSSALWLVKDLIDFSIAEAAVDAFFVPVRKGTPQKAEAVVAHLPELIELRTSLEAMGLKLVIVDIAELALRNLLLKKEEEQKSLGLLYIDQEHVQLMVVQNDLIGLIRRLNTLLAADSEPSAKSQLVLEIQRSLDFYQTQLGKPTPTKLYLNPSSELWQPWI